MLKIYDRKISRDTPPYIIAELSANHNGSLKKAKELILSAKKNGADAVKLQTYTPDTMTIDSDKDDFLIKGGIWNGYSLYKLYEEAHTPIDWHKKLFSYAKEIDLTIFSTPFDESAVDLLEELDVPAYKIASFELVDLPLIRYVAKNKKPILMSTGMASPEEISEAIDAARSEGCNDILLFHCISSYPTPICESNLRNIVEMKKKYSVEVGLSDHTLGTIAATSAVVLGATAVEKHFTLSRNDKSHDSKFSIEPEELNLLVKNTFDAWSSIGSKGFNRSTLESQNKTFRRSLYFVKDMKAGDKITNKDIRRIRPGYGLPPKYLEKVIGNKVNIDIKFGDRVSWDVIDRN